MATIYQCMYRSTPVTSACGSMNQGKRDKCKGCKSSVRAIEGHAVLIPWRGDSRYQLTEAVREFATMAGADRAAAKAYESDNSSELVARFLLS